MKLFLVARQQNKGEKNHKRLCLLVAIFLLSFQSGQPGKKKIKTIIIVTRHTSALSIASASVGALTERKINKRLLIILVSNRHIKKI